MYKKLIASVAVLGIIVCMALLMSSCGGSNAQQGTAVVVEHGNNLYTLTLDLEGHVGGTYIVAQAMDNDVTVEIPATAMVIVNSTPNVRIVLRLGTDEYYYQSNGHEYVYVGSTTPHVAGDKVLVSKGIVISAYIENGTIDRDTYAIVIIEGEQLQ